MNVFYKKVILFGIIVILAIPLSFFIIKNLQKNLEGNKNKEFFQKFEFQEIKEKKKEIQTELEKIEGMIKETTTSTTTTE